ncbi:Tn3 family transposase [Streptomyces sp. NPDC030920]|uniref:Tn3 family transposase n=1 Tax=Streptomyces sp. NPDC030920 TaxID=3365308 RepID=UPI0038505EBA
MERQAAIPLAWACGGGLVAPVDGMRFVVPVPSVYTRPNPKYFGCRGGATRLDTIKRSGGGAGREGRGRHPTRLAVRAGRPSTRDGGKRPEMIVTDTASYSDIAFRLLTLAGFAYRVPGSGCPRRCYRCRSRSAALRRGRESG